jgi:hypothetical protein
MFTYIGLFVGLSTSERKPYPDRSIVHVQREPGKVECDVAADWIPWPGDGNVIKKVCPAAAAAETIGTGSDRVCMDE